MSTLAELHPNIFVQNKYLKWYEQLISNPTEIKKSEKHHIIPKSIVKNDVLVRLTLRQHYIAHLLLTHCVVPAYRKKMVYAVSAMQRKITPNIRFNSKLFEKFKMESNQLRSLRTKGIPRPESTKQKIREKRALQVISPETCAKMSAARKGKPRSSESIEKTRLAHIGSKRSEKTKQNLRESRVHYPRLTCEHCGIECVTANYNRWHGTNCKHRTNDVI